MKRFAVILNVCALVLFATSCSTSKQARQYKQTIDGNWQLSSVQSEGITGTVKAMLFDDADMSCFVGSTWTFNSHNSLGTYTITGTGTGCSALKRNIRWSIYEAADEPKLLQFKRLDDKYKAVDENSGGYRFTILSLDNTNMKVRSDITFEGKPSAFIYNFIRI